MPNITKYLQQKHFSYIRLGQLLNIGASPYEPHGMITTGSSGPLAGGAVYDGLQSASTFNANLGNPRTDIKLTSFKMSGLGGTFTHQGKGKGLGYDQFTGKRSMATYIYELGNTGNYNWECYSGGLAINSVITPDGVSIRNGVNGLDTVTIQSATPDYFLGQLELPQMPYMLFQVANDEQMAWYNLAQQPVATIQNTLQAPLRGTGKGGIADQKYSEPFPGFGAYIDQYTATIGSVSNLPPPNPSHFLVRLSPPRALCEVLDNHLNITINGVRKKFTDVFGVDIQAGKDPESDLMHFELSGSVSSMIQTVAQQGFWRAWYDAESNFHLVPDYFGPPNFFSSNFREIQPMVELHYGPSLIGELEVNPGTVGERVNRAGVKPQQFLGYGDNTNDVLTDYYNKPLGAIYPPGKQAGGNDRNMDNYPGKRADIQARNLFYRSSAMTTFTWSNVPFPMAALWLFNKVISITGTDPRNGWVCNDKRFVVTDVEGQLDDPERADGGNGMLCTLSGIEIDPSVNVKLGTYIGTGS